VDRALVESAQRGDRDAFSALMALVGDHLFAVAYRILRDQHLAEDAFQEASLLAWRKLPTLRESDRFEAWIQRLLVHACYAESRRRTRWTSTIRVLEVDGDVAGRAPDPLDRDEIDRAFRDLSLEHRAVFVLHHYVGLPLVEVAATLGIPAGTARSRLHYATQALRHALVTAPAMATPKERLA
jgi:RNA polymerase sigma-70 factor (ECF subfamily)